MGKPLRVLMVEDSEEDVLLVIHALEQGGYDPVYERVETPDDMAAALHRETWDIVLSDYTMPRFSGPAAIKLLKETGLNVPLILVSGKMGEETAVEALKAGAHDYVMKNNLIRLAPAVERALEETTARIRDRQAAQRQALYTRLLDVLNNPDELGNLIRNIISLVRENTGIEAVAIRLHKGEDFPYYETSGFTPHFLKTAKSLCVRDAAGEIIRDAHGKPLLECMCGNVLSGRTDPSQPYFTEGGSFWTNSTSKLLASAPQEDRQPERMNRCQSVGYESVALIPLKSGDKTIGLLQFNDKRPDRFSPESIHFLESIGASIGIAVNRQRTMEALRNSEKKYRALVDFLPITILETDREGKIITVNRTASALFGLTHDDLGRGTSIHQLVSPKDLEKIKDHFLKLKAGNARVDGEYTLSMLDGSEFPAHLFSTPIVQKGRITGFRCAVIDATEIKQAQDACRMSEEKYRSISENALEGFFQNTPDGRLVSANAAFARMIGYESPEEMTAAAFTFARHYYVNPEARKELVSLLKERGSVNGFEFEAYRKDGSKMWASTKVRAVKNEKGDILYHEGFVEDITKRRETDEQLRQAYLVLHETSDRLIETDKLAAVGTLAAGVAHEILNPVNIIATGIAALGITQELSEPVKEAFAIFRRQIDLIVRITRDLQQFSRRSAGEVELTDVRELIRYTLSLCEPRYKMEKVTQEIECDDAVPKIAMDRNRMGQVFLNIFNNAVDAMEGKDTKALRIRIKGVSEPGTGANRVLIAISDLGGGIAAEDLNRIFDPFFTTKKVGKGTGLGLSISHSIVQNHGGRIWAENNSSGGTTFFVELPVELGQDQSHS